MGLHLNFELRLPLVTPVDELSAVLSRLREFALDLPFKRVSPVYHPPFLNLKGVDWDRESFELLASIISRPNDAVESPLVGDVSTAVGFIVWPGLGCEPATFGFLRRSDEHGQEREWFWHVCCKTQHASQVSENHLVTCHTSLVKVLDHAIALGIDVIVRDETHYWETRDESRLIAEVRKWNKIIGEIAGKLSEAMGPILLGPGFFPPGFPRAKPEE